MKTTTALAETPDGLEAEPAAAPNIIAMAHKNKAIPPIVPDSIVEDVLVGTRSPPPPRIPVAAPPAVSVSIQTPEKNFGLDEHAEESERVETRDTQTMTELPPLPPGTASSSRSESTSVKPNSESLVPQPTAEHRARSESTDDTTAPATTSTCESDPIEYYRRLQESIRTGVESAKREQQQQLRALRSRFGQQVLRDDDESDLTEELVDDNATDTTYSTHTADATEESSIDYYHRHRGKLSQQRHNRHSRHILEDNMLQTDTADEIRAAISNNNNMRSHQRHQQEGSSSLSSRGSTTMTDAIRRPKRNAW
eukprot:CAMPEP_0176455018 /NCGR_PEP_ID=MMETSP0127-20121128/30348_1 /TAXON_ID=938130 /ORGANISM="Platyophrya macrostoma, Strain WH" /LENGTH=309 /DNA_ID=CAMNT_0017844517 /DNA_START=22 /DNA_END=951 /DNA_ORIENTATION=-